MQSCLNSIYLVVVLFILGTGIVHGEPGPMAKPTQPDIFTNQEELRKYLDHVTDFYSLNGKARYGKRGNVLSSVPEVNYVWDSMKTILENSQRSQQPKANRQFEKRKQEESGFLDEVEKYGPKKSTSRIDSPPCHVLDTVEKYYDDVQ